MLMFSALVLLSPSVSASEIVDRPSQMPQFLFEAMRFPSGSQLCDKRMKRRQARAFDKRYGQRVLRLANAIGSTQNSGWSQGATARSACVKLSRKDLEQALDGFDWTLTGFEDHYGLSEPPQATTLCQLVSTPTIYSGMRVTVRGGLADGHPESGSWLVDPECGGISVSIFDSEILRQIQRPRYEGSGQKVTFATFTGRVGSRGCGIQVPPGSTCGPFLSVSHVEKVDHSDQCWTTRRITSGVSRQVPGSCP